MQNMPLDHLLQRVSDAVRRLPGVTALYLYGSAADPARRDAYSDLDLQVVTEQYTHSRSAWPWGLGQAGEIELAYPLSEQAHQSAFSLAFAGESLYHKVDIGLNDAAFCEQFLHGIEPKICLWQQAAGAGPVPALPGEAVCPEMGSDLHFLIGEWMSAVRYAKARQRGQHLTCWRFLSAKVNALLRWSGHAAAGQPLAGVALSTWDYVALDRALPEDERLALLAGVRLDTPRAMDRSLVEITRRISERVYPRSSGEETPAARLIDQYAGFVACELGIPPDTSAD